MADAPYDEKTLQAMYELLTAPTQYLPHAMSCGAFLNQQLGTTDYRDGAMYLVTRGDIKEIVE